MGETRVLLAGWGVALALGLSTTGCGDRPQQEARPGSPAPPSTPAPASAPAKGVPEWVPLYPGARVSDVENRNAGVETYTTFQLESPKDCEAVFAWYDEKLKVAGFNVVKNVGRVQGCSGIMRAEGPGNTRALNLNGGEAAGGASRIGVQAVVRQLPGAGTPDAGEAVPPAWIPRYPGSKPANVVVRQAGPERSVDFSFTTGDDAQTVVGWYERALRDASFTIVGSTVFDASTAKLTAQDPTGRSILNIRVEPAGGAKVVAIQARDGVQ